MFLPTDDLTQLTGHKRPSAQIRWLQENRWKFTVNAAGRPVVTEAEAEHQLVSRTRRPREQHPNLEALKREG